MKISRGASPVLPSELLKWDNLSIQTRTIPQLDVNRDRRDVMIWSTLRSCMVWNVTTKEEISGPPELDALYVRTPFLTSAVIHEESEFGACYLNLVSSLEYPWDVIGYSIRERMMDFALLFLPTALENLWSMDLRAGSLRLRPCIRGSCEWRKPKWFLHSQITRCSLETRHGAVLQGKIYKVPWQETRHVAECLFSIWLCTCLISFSHGRTKSYQPRMQEWYVWW